MSATSFLSRHWETPTRFSETEDDLGEDEDQEDWEDEPVVVLSDDEDTDEDDDCGVVGGEDWHRVQHFTAAATYRTPACHASIKRLDIFGDIDLTTGICVPLEDGTWLRIKDVLEDRRTKEITLRGWILLRNRCLRNKITKEPGEVYLSVVVVDENDRRPDLERGLEARSISKVDFSQENLVRKVVFTNKNGSAHRDPARWNYRDKIDRAKWQWEQGSLVCRRMHIQFIDPEKGGLEKPPKEHVIRWLTEDEADEGCAMPDVVRTILHVSAGRNATTHEKHTRQTEVTSTIHSSRKRTRSFDDTYDVIEEVEELRVHSTTRKHEIERVRPEIKQGNKYAAGDVCCGGCGATGGVQEAGFKMVWGIDRDPAAAKTFSLNCPEGAAYEMDMSDFIRLEVNKCEYCHVLHISFTCKAFSWAHTHEGPDDEENRQANLAAAAFLNPLRPRFVTFENTDGFKAMRKHQEWFDAFLHTITAAGYNIRWKIVDLAGFGAPQRRKRLIVIASWFVHPPLTNAAHRQANKYIVPASNFPSSHCQPMVMLMA